MSVEARGTHRRHAVVGFTVLAMVLAYTDRVNLAVASVAMREAFHWSQSVKGLVLAGFFVGYFLFQVPAGALARRLGGKTVLGCAVLAWSAFALVTPTAAALGVAVLIAARIGLGLGEAAVLPATYEIFSRWIPAGERGRALAFFLGGIPLGQIAGFAATGYLTAHLGWPASFYLFGVLGLAWAATFLSRVHDDPARDPRLDAAERARLPVAQAAPRAATPWRVLLSSPLVLSFIAAHVCHNWALYVLLSWLPSYFHDHLGLTLLQAGLYSALPWGANFLVLIGAGALGDALIARGAHALGVRRMLAALGLLLTALCFLSLARVSAAPEALALTCATAGAIGLCAAGFTPVPLDITPRFAATLIGASNMLATLPGIAGVAITGWLVDITGTYASTFLVSAAVAGAGALSLAAAAGSPVPKT